MGLKVYKITGNPLDWIYDPIFQNLKLKWWAELLGFKIHYNLEPVESKQESNEFECVAFTLTSVEIKWFNKVIERHILSGCRHPKRKEEYVSTYFRGTNYLENE